MKKQICIVSAVLLCMHSVALTASAETASSYPETFRGLKRADLECDLFGTGIYYGESAETGNAYFYHAELNALSCYVEFADGTDQDAVKAAVLETYPEDYFSFGTDDGKLRMEVFPGGRVVANNRDPEKNAAAAKALCRKLEQSFVVTAAKYTTESLIGSPTTVNYSFPTEAYTMQELQSAYEALIAEDASAQGIFAAVKQMKQDYGVNPNYITLAIAMMWYEYEDIRLTGDITGEGKIDLGDAAEAIFYYCLNDVTLIENDYLTGDALTAADVTGNGTVDLDDAIAIMQYYNLNDVAEMPTPWGEIVK